MTPAEQEKKRGLDRAWCAANLNKLRKQRRAWKAANVEKQRAYKRAFKAANPDKVRAWNRKQHLRKMYGITQERFDRIFAEQSGACAVCGSIFAGQKRRPHVDHCHETGKVRSLLCHNCNAALGHARDQPSILRELAAYIERHAAT